MNTVGDGYREMMRLPEFERLDYMVKYAQVLEECSDVDRIERHQLMEDNKRLAQENERLRRAIKTQTGWHPDSFPNWMANRGQVGKER